MFNSEARWDCYVCGCDVTLCCLGAQTDVTVRSLTCHAAVATGLVTCEQCLCQTVICHPNLNPSAFYRIISLFFAFLSLSVVCRL